MKILHVLYQSLPQISGSTIRSRDILMSQNEIGMDAFAVTAPFVDIGFKNNVEIIDGIKYYRTNTSKHSKNKITDEYRGFFKRLKKLFEIPKFIFKLHKLCKEEDPDVLHAHAMFFCGIASLIVGKINKKPVFYEVRSLWMLPKDNSYRSLMHKLLTKLLLKIEIFTMSLAHTVFVVNENLKNKIIGLGVNPAKLVVVKNAVNTTLINKKLEKEFFKSKRNKIIVFGYIGSITPYEGIPLMLQALRNLNLKGVKFKYYIYGSVREPNELEVILRKIKEYSLEGMVQYKGSINPSKISEAYQKIDVIVNPRLKNKITDTVTPLKPLEAMAYKKIFIGSDVGGIKDLLKNNDYGFLFESDNVKSLENILLEVSSLSFEIMLQQGEGSRNYVMEKQSWLENAKIYKQEYYKFLN